MKTQLLTLPYLKPLFSLLCAICVGIIAVHMFLVYAATQHVILAFAAETTTQTLQEDLMDIAGQVSVASHRSSFEISHIVVIEPVSVSVAH